MSFTSFYIVLLSNVGVSCDFSQTQQGNPTSRCLSCRRLSNSGNEASGDSRWNVVKPCKTPSYWHWIWISIVLVTKCNMPIINHSQYYEYNHIAINGCKWVVNPAKWWVSYWDIGKQQPAWLQTRLAAACLGLLLTPAIETEPNTVFMGLLGLWPQLCTNIPWIPLIWW